MSDAMSRIKQISIDGDGILITYADHNAEAAAWLIDYDVLDNSGRPYTIYHSICSKCGQTESGFPDEAGLYCRRCGSFMVNGQPGEFDKEEWQKGIREAELAAVTMKIPEDAAEGEEDDIRDGTPEE